MKTTSTESLFKTPADPMEAMGTPTTEPGRPHVQGELLNTRLTLWGFHSALF